MFVVLLRVKRTRKVGVTAALAVGRVRADLGDRVGVEVSSKVWRERRLGIECGGLVVVRSAGRRE